jgi:hypothetical protein
VSPRRSALLGLLLSAVLTGCGIVPAHSPLPTPADFQDLAALMARQGIAIAHVVSGDAGCSDPVLTPTAISLDGSGLGQSPPVRLYLYIFRNHDAFDRLRSTIDACAKSYVTDAETFQSIDESPYVIAGQGPWTAAFEAALRTGLKNAAGDGGAGSGSGE